MNPLAALIDEALLERRHVQTCVPDNAGNGFDVVLSCGHLIWMAVQPPAQCYCGACLEGLIRQIRSVQAHQEPGR